MLKKVLLPILERRVVSLVRLSGLILILSQCTPLDLMLPNLLVPGISCRLGEHEMVLGGIASMASSYGLGRLVRRVHVPGSISTIRRYMSVPSVNRLCPKGIAKLSR
jgi:hypothetical protein